MAHNIFHNQNQTTVHPLTQVRRPTRREQLSEGLQSGEIDDLQRLHNAFGAADIAGPMDLLDAAGSAQGLSPRSPLDIFLGRGNEGDFGVSDPDSIPGHLGAGFQRTTGAGVELLAEIINAGGNVTKEGLSPAGNLLQALGGDENVQDVLGFLTGIDMGEDDLTQPDDQGEVDAMEQAHKRAAQAATNLEMVNQIDTAALTPEAQLQADNIRKNLEQELLLAEQELTELESKTDLQNQLLNAQERALFGDAGLLPGVSDEEAQRLQEALDLGVGEGGLQPEVLEAIEAIMSSNLSVAEQEDRLGFVIDQASLKNEMLTAVGNITQNRDDFQKILAKTDAELLGDMAEFQNPQLRFDLQVTPEERELFAIDEAVTDFFETKFGQDIPSAAGNQVATIIEAAMARPGFLNTPGGASLVDQVAATIPGANPSEIATGIMDAVNRGLEAGAQRNQFWDEALTYNSFNPGGEDLAVALFQTGIGLGLDPEMATAVAESGDLHRIIDAKSGGKIDATTGGNQFGIGGLTEDAYLRMGYDPEELVGDTAGQLAALIEYVTNPEVGFASPVEAIEFWKRTGDWGS